MKRYFYIAIIAGFVASCANDSAEEFLPQNKKIETAHFSDMEKDSDTTANTTTSTTNPDPDTGGQGGSTPIKPPKP